MLKNSKLVLASMSLLIANGVSAADYSADTDALALQIAMENSVNTDASEKEARELLAEDKNTQKDTWDFLIAKKVEADLSNQKAIQAAYEDLTDAENQATYLAIYNAI